MKRKKTTLIIFTALVVGLTLSSCNTWLDRGEDTYASWATLSMTYQEDGLPARPFYFITDDTLVLCPMNHSSVDANFKPFDGQRLVLFFKAHKFAEGTGTPTPEKDHIAYIDIIQMQMMSTKGIVSTLEPDTLGTDPMEPEFLWFGGTVFGTNRYLNVQLMIPAMEPNDHTFDLVQDLNRESPLEDGYYFLELRHNEKKDAHFIDYTARMSFLLDGDCAAEDVKGLKIRIRTINQGVKIYTLDY
ncbi:MAG: NigD-like C-terminal domain-containing protein [Bacteroidales bacterium]|jgi:predicted small secreted protein|nr:NigD-like C-terminal domain-containing protein [Bacteroidales bacterium]HHV40432.1 hypothetical protein [Bacteroidales bacterium]